MIKKIYSHRGNLSGSEKNLENNPEYIQKALDYDPRIYVEVDVWFIDGSFYLGHDSPLHKTDKFYFFNKRILTHCKNTEAFIELSKYSEVDCFFQEGDIISLSSSGKKIFHSDYFLKNEIKNTGRNDIYVHLDKGFSFSGEIQGIVTDYPISYLNIVKDKEKCPFDLFVIDIDGVMTDGTKIYGTEGQVIGKRYCDKDFTAIKRFKASGVEVCFLSGDLNVNSEMAKIRGIDFYYGRDPNTGNIDKSNFIPILKEKYGDVEMAYIGDDYYDLTIIENLKYTFCPSCASKEIKKSVYKVLKTKGGEGAIAEVFDLYKDKLDNKFPYDSHKVNN